MALPATLRGKLLGVMLASTLVSVLVALGLMTGYDLWAYHRGWVVDVSAQAELLGHTTAPALAFDNARDAHQNLALLRLQPKVRTAAIYDAQGRVFASYAAADTIGGVNKPLPPAPQPDGARVVDGDLQVFRQIVEHGQPLGAVYVRAQYELVDRFMTYAGLALAVALLAMGVALGVASRL